MLCCASSNPDETIDFDTDGEWPDYDGVDVPEDGEFSHQSCEYIAPFHSRKMSK